jgi:hypothetical protein
MWAANNKATLVGVPKLVEAHIMTSHSLNDIHGALGLNICLLSFSLDLVSSFLAILLFFLLGMGLFTLCHCILEVLASFFFYFTWFTPKSLS